MNRNWIKIRLKKYWYVCMKHVCFFIGLQKFNVDTIFTNHKFFYFCSENCINVQELSYRRVSRKSQNY